MPFNSLAKDTKDDILGMMPPDQFLDEFLPCTEKRPEDLHPNANWDATSKSSLLTEGDHEFAKTICTSLNNSAFCPHTDYHKLDEKERSGLIDVIGHRKHALDPKGAQDVAKGYITVKFKRFDCDPFDCLRKFSSISKDTNDPSPAAGNSDVKTSDQCKSIWKNNSSAQSVCNQLCMSCLGIFQHQLCGVVYTLLLVNSEARIIRWDHGGAVVTELFDITDPILADFLWHLDRASPDSTGRDTSVRPLDGNSNPDDAELVQKARDAFARFEDAPYEVPKTEPLREVTVWDEERPDAVGGRPTARKFVATQPRNLCSSLTGRWTHGYVAYDPDTERVVYIKDTWRIDDPKFEREGKTYEMLREAGVRNVLDVACAGDVLGEDGAPQSTRTHEFAKAGWARGPGRRLGIKYTHYRMVFRDVGRPLHTFCSTRELCQVLKDAIDAHTDAFSALKILHGDISIGNILIRNGRGLLIDWDLCLHDGRTSDSDSKWDVGTWQFKSIALLAKTEDNRAHRLRDDLEAFFWLLLYMLFQFRYWHYHGSGCVTIGEGYMNTLFNQVETKGTKACGGAGKLRFLSHNGRPNVGETLGLLDERGREIPEPLAVLVIELRINVGELYAPERPAVPLKNRRRKRGLGSSEKVRRSKRLMEKKRHAFDEPALVQAMFDKALSSYGWHDDDGARTHRPKQDARQLKTKAPPKAAPTKRPRSAPMPKRERLTSLPPDNHRVLDPGTKRKREPEKVYDDGNDRSRGRFAKRARR